MKTGAFIVPTGVGASIGGFAGDASIWARKFAEKCRLIVNPNVIFNTLKSNTNGCDNPNSCPKASQLSQSTCAESFPMLKDILWMNFLREIYA